ncbi:hypothetical protein ACWGJ2_32985 [Streptomyces sp. NPDC054796]
MTSAQDTTAETIQRGKATGKARLTQIAGDYEEHNHQYVRGWEYLRGSTVDGNEMELVKHAFVDPPGPGGSGQTAHALRLLTRHHAPARLLALCGETGTGLRAIAIHLLHKAGVPDQKIRCLALDWDRPRTEQIPHTPGHGFVLDLRRYRTLPEDFYTGLASLHKAAEAAEAILIILADPGGWNPGTLATVPTVQMVRAHAQQIAETHLRHLAAHRVDWLSGDPLKPLLTDAVQPSEAARLAWLIAQARGDGEEGKNAVAEEFTDWRAHLAGWFEDHAEPEELRERCFLLAAALLEGAPAATVLDAADVLFHEVGGKLPPGGALAGRDLDKRREVIRASLVEGEGLSLEAERHGLPQAVLTYVWEQRPQLRSVLLEWASRISGPKGTAVHHLRRIADCLVQLSLLPGGAVVGSVATEWIEAGGAAHRRLAREVLETMALHPVTGVAVRKQLYDWALQKSTSQKLATAVAQICAGQLGRHYPRVALTRLRLLAARSDEAARDAVADAVRTLLEVPERRMLVLSEIVGWAEAQDGDTRKAGAHTFLALTGLDGDALPLRPPAAEASGGPADGTADWFIRGWRAALAEPATAEAAYGTLEAWLDSEELADELVMPLATEVLRERIGRTGAAALLVGASASTETGRARRRQLVSRLVSPPSPAPAGPGPEPAVAQPGGRTGPAAE